MWYHKLSLKVMSESLELTMNSKIGVWHIWQKRVFYQSYYGVPSSNRKVNLSNGHLSHGHYTPHSWGLISMTSTSSLRLDLRYSLCITETGLWRHWKQCVGDPQGESSEGVVLAASDRCHRAALGKPHCPEEGALLVQEVTRHSHRTFRGCCGGSL